MCVCGVGGGVTNFFSYRDDPFPEGDWCAEKQTGSPSYDN